MGDDNILYGYVIYTCHYNAKIIKMQLFFEITDLLDI